MPHHGPLHNPEQFPLTTRAYHGNGSAKQMNFDPLIVRESKVAKEEWGSKRTCPKCSTRFYDLQKDDPVTCIDCGHAWVPEPILKTKQPILIKDEEEEAEDKTEAEGEDDIAEVADNADADDSVLADVSLDDDDDIEASGILDTSLEKGDE